MTAELIDGRAAAAAVRSRLKVDVDALVSSGTRPGLAVVLVGDDPASHTYVRSKTAACAEVGIRTFDHRLSADTPTTDLLTLIAALNLDADVDGILIQLPLPAGIDARRVLLAVDPTKDVDGFHPENLGRLLMGEPRFVACTPLGVMKLLEVARTPLAGADAIVVGRSNIVGKPMAALLLAANATVTIAHSMTRNLPERVRQADVVIAAVGRPELIRGAWIKPGATVIDVGTNRSSAGKLIGDVEFAEAARHARAISPVPGGVGPMTIAMLLANTVLSAQRRAGGEPTTAPAR